MVAGISLLQKIMSSPNVNPVKGIEQGASARRTQPQTGEVNGANPFAAISRIDCEKTPDVGAAGSSFTNGLGHSIHTKNFLC